MGIHSTGQVCCMIHSGSRGLGHQVATDALVQMEATDVINSDTAQNIGEGMASASSKVMEGATDVINSDTAQNIGEGMAGAGETVLSGAAAAGSEGLEGWYQLYNISMWNTPTPPGAKAIGTYYYRLPPLSAEIAMAAIQNSGNDRCAATIDIFAQVNGRLDGIDLEWELFQEQLHQVILIGESVMQVTVAFPSTWIPPESTLYT